MSVLTIDRLGVNYRLDEGHFTSSLDIMLPRYMQTALNRVRSYLNRAIPRWRQLIVVGSNAVAITENGNTVTISKKEISAMEDIEIWMETEREWLLTPDEEEEEIACLNARSPEELEEIPSWLENLTSSAPLLSEKGNGRMELKQEPSTQYHSDSGEKGVIERLCSSLRRAIS